MRNWTVILLLTMLPSLSWGQTQTYYQYKTDESEWQGASQADMDHRLRVSA